MLILNATADDFENLEQIYHCLSLEFSAENYGSADQDGYYWRESKVAVPLAEIAEGVRNLVQRGLLSVRLEDYETPAGAPNDLSYVWRGWFRVTPKGAALLAAESVAE